MKFQILLGSDCERTKLNIEESDNINFTAGPTAVQENVDIHSLFVQDDRFHYIQNEENIGIFTPDPIAYALQGYRILEEMNDREIDERSRIGFRETIGEYLEQEPMH